MFLAIFQIRELDVGNGSFFLISNVFYAYAFQCHFVEFEGHRIVYLQTSEWFINIDWQLP